MYTNAEKKIYTVAELNATARFALESHFGKIWIIGEISNLSQPNSGHVYFSLKDAQAQIRCALFRALHQRLGFSLQNGQQVLLSGEVSLYEARGDFQLIVSHLVRAGEGALQLAFEQLKNRLAKEGLFDLHLKKPLPKFPTQIGIITSPSGAAIHDILTVLKNRFSGIPVIIYPSLVQGEFAAQQIAEMLFYANQHAECDILILARGGGSLEDLWPFNTELVARAISASEIPVVTGIGHEIDFTIADLVADHRAATPSAAAAQVTPDWREWQYQLRQMQQRFLQLIKNQLQHNQLKLISLAKGLRHPRENLQEHQQQLNNLQQRLMIHIQYQIQHSQQTLNHLAYSLQTISPLATLDRGYSIVRHQETKKIIRSSAEVKIHDQLHIQLSHGSLHCEVKQIQKLGGNPDS